MFKKRVKGQGMRVADEVLFAVGNEGGKAVELPEEKERLSDKYVEIPLDLLKKPLVDEEEERETPAQQARREKLAAKISESHKRYDDPEYQLQQKSKFKTATNIDFNPSICKDFHDSGYCSWGESCLYAHDRTSYKRGWELDAEWEKEQREKLAKGTSRDISQNQSECPICNKEFENPVKTSCSHIFCETCILKTPKAAKFCFVCGKKLDGKFNAVSKKKLSTMGQNHDETPSKKTDFGALPDYISPLPKLGRREANERQKSDIQPVIINQSDFDAEDLKKLTN